MTMLERNKPSSRAVRSRSHNPDRDRFGSGSRPRSLHHQRRRQRESSDNIGVLGQATHNESYRVP